MTGRDAPGGSPSGDPGRWAWAEIDLDAIRANVETLRAIVAPSDLWAVVKANGYGHGAVAVARAALDGGAAGLCVALVDEGVELRTAGIDAPILVLSEQPSTTMGTLVEQALTPTVYSADAVDAVTAAVSSRGLTDFPVHLKIDTGMQRVGAHPDDTSALVSRIRSSAPALRLAGIFTHLAVADEPSDSFTADQLARFDETLRRAGVTQDGADPPGPVLHTANSAGALAHPDARRSFVRAGIAIYGIAPGPALAASVSTLRPALSLKTRVSFTKRVVAGSRISYGLRHTFERDTTVATVPIGYADGVPRRLSDVGASVLVGGRLRPIVGVITMDQLMIDCGPDDHEVRVGDEVVLIGEQLGPDGPRRIRAEDWADRLGTIGYEVVCGISSRVPRRLPRSIGP